MFFCSRSYRFVLAQEPTCLGMDLLQAPQLNGVHRSFTVSQKAVPLLTAAALPPGLSAAVHGGTAITALTPSATVPHGTASAYRSTTSAACGSSGAQLYQASGNGSLLLLHSIEGKDDLRTQQGLLLQAALELRPQVPVALCVVAVRGGDGGVA